MKKFIPFIMGVLMVIFEWKVSNSFHMLCSLYSDVEDIFVYLFHCAFVKVCILGLRESVKNTESKRVFTFLGFKSPCLCILL